MTVRIATLLFAFATGAAIITPANALAQADEGSFALTVDGRPAGNERFEIRQSGGGRSAETLANGQITLRLPTGGVELSTRLRATGIRATPTAYRVDVGGGSRRNVVGTVADGRFSAKILTPSGEQLREYAATDGAVLLDASVAHHYYFLAQRLREGRVAVLIPQENRQVMATVENRGDETIRIGEQPVGSTHLVVRVAPDDERHVWIDVLNRVLRVESCTAGHCYRAERVAAPS